GNGWQYRFDAGHMERERPVARGWQVTLSGGFIPKFVVSPTIDHPLTFVLEDGRTYQFEALLECDGALSSVHPVRPSFPELSGTGATLTALNSARVPYSTTEFDEVVIDDTAFEGDFVNEWEPSFYQLHTNFNEDILFEVATGRMISFADGSGFKF